MKDNSEGNYIRNIVNRADVTYLSEAKRVYTISENVTTRMQNYSGLHSTPLYHPCPDMDKFYCGEYDNYILMPSRINITKRQLLAVEAMLHTKKNGKLYVVGKADNEYERERLLSLIKEKRLNDRIKYLDFVSQEEKLKLYANARAVLFIPWDEDYGYITLESMAASKAVITASDSGGPLEFISDGQNGKVIEPDAKALAEAMDELFGSESLAKEYGKAAQRTLQEKEISWAHVVKELTKK